MMGSHPYQLQPAAKPVLNPTTRHLQGDHFKAPAAPFRRYPSLFIPWRTSLERKIVELGLSTGHIIDILEAHTVGEAQKVVQTLKVATIKDKLQERLGNAPLITVSLRRQLSDLPMLSHMNHIKVRELFDTCSLILIQITDLNDLTTFIFSSYQKIIIKKLPRDMAHKWHERVATYQYQHSDTHLPFHIFCHILEECNCVINNPCQPPALISTAPPTLFFQLEQAICITNCRLWLRM